MKLTNKLCAAALLAVLGTSLALPNVAQAVDDPFNWTNKGSVKFIEDDGKGDKPVDPTDPTNPIDPNNPIIKPPVNPAEGPLKVITITDLNFGADNKVTPASGKGWEYTAKAAEVEYKDNTKKQVPNFVQFKDTRADNKANKHTLTAKATKFTNTEKQELKSAELKFANVSLISSSDQNQANVDGVPVTRELKADGTTPTTFVTQDKDDKGFGQFVLNFGDDTTKAESVKLWVPASGNKLSTSSSYTSTITWTIADAR